MNFIDRLSSWILPKYEFDNSPCDELAEWEIVDNSLDITYSCTFHLSDIVSVDTKTILPNPTNETCKYCYSILEELV